MPCKKRRLREHNRTTAKGHLGRRTNELALVEINAGRLLNAKLLCNLVLDLLVPQARLELHELVLAVTVAPARDLHHQHLASLPEPLLGRDCLLLQQTSGTKREGGGGYQLVRVHVCACVCACVCVHGA